jgi:hypothetical protein
MIPPAAARSGKVYLHIALVLLVTHNVFAHDLANADDDSPPQYDPTVLPPTKILLRPPTLLLSGTNRGAAIASIFQPFAPGVKTRWDDIFFYVESYGMPAHRMMVGITAWQQQVPLPQSYFGDNAWQFPLQPVVATNPISAKTHFFRGAIAIAVNGVPIFNPIKNDGHTDTYLAGELDEFGGHAGRADDYHYHIAPLHLQQYVGSNNPIAFALDGYPIYGLNEPDGSTPVGLDEFNGHTTPQLGYHYHASKKYPYVNGGFHGVVTESGGQVDPQPRAQPVRPAASPLPGAVITDFKSEPDIKGYTLSYTIGGQKAQLHYSETPGSVTFDFTDSSGKTVTKNYSTNLKPNQTDNPPSQPEANGERPPRDPNRQPWLKVHAKEMDLNHDGILTRAEFIAEVDNVFAVLDRKHDGKLTVDEYGGPPVRSPMGGYIKQHYKELLDENGVITKASLMKEAMRMFDKTDLNHDGQLTPDETALPPGYKAEPPGRSQTNPPPQ